MPKQSKKTQENKAEKAERLPFPTAALVRLMRKNLEPKKQIKKRVKVELNLWLGKLVEQIAKRMNAHPYTYVDYSMFKEAIEVYEKLEEVQAEKERIIVYLEKIKSDIDELEREVGKKFDVEGEV
jgi:histone H3/H4